MNKEEFLKYMEENYKGDYPLLRKFMSSKEIKFANQLVKEGKLVKGHSSEPPHTVIYYYDEGIVKKY